MTPEMVHAITESILALLGPVTATVIGIFAARRAGAEASRSAAGAATAKEHSAIAKDAATTVVNSLRPVSFGPRV
jgi:hypothetical protein